MSGAARLEYGFAALIDGKLYPDLPDGAKGLAKTLFKDSLALDAPISCRVLPSGKSGIYLKQGDLGFGVSLKAPTMTMVHMEKVSSFLVFLEDIGAPSDIVSFFADWLSFGGGRGAKSERFERLSAFAPRTKAFNAAIAAMRPLREAILERAVFLGLGEGVASSAYYCGDPYDGVYATRNQISTYLHHRKWSQNFTPTVGPLAFAPYVPAGKENDPSSRRIVFRWADLLADLNYIASRFDDYSA